MPALVLKLGAGRCTEPTAEHICFSSYWLPELLPHKLYEISRRVSGKDCTAGNTSALIVMRVQK
jgi:hypothetical protein